MMSPDSKQLRSWSLSLLALVILVTAIFSSVNLTYGQSQPPDPDSPPSQSYIEGVLQIEADSTTTQALILTDPWGAISPVVDQFSGGPQDAISELNSYVVLGGFWQSEAFVATSIQTISTDGEQYAAYIRREMSNPALDLSDQPSPPQADQPPGNPGQVGEWSAVQDIGMYALHAVVRPDGKVQFWYRTVVHWPSEPSFNTILWDPATGATTSIPNHSANGEENWCASHTQLGDGRMLAVSGSVGVADPHATIFNPLQNIWSAQPDLHFGRYYPSTTFMGDGRAVVSGGDYITPGTTTTPNPFPEVWENGAWRVFDDPLVTTPTPIEFDFFYGSFFPWTQQAPNGKIFYAGPQNNLRYLDPNGGGTVTDAGERDGISRDYGGYATYDVGKVLIAGGGSSLTTAYTIDYSGSSPVVAQTGSMTHGRRHFYTTILADGSVLATGGNGDGGLTQGSASGAVFAAERWDPQTGVWSELAEMDRRREYHSAAVLLPDGRVVHAGGDCTSCSPEANLEVFSPPYLFNTDGTAAARPTINSIERVQPGLTLPSTPHLGGPQPEFDYGELLRLNFGAASAIDKVHLIRLGSSTHSTNFDQRLVPLSFTSSGNDLALTAPLNTYIAPPGYYMLFIVSDAGVPSEATIIKLGGHIERLEEMPSFHDGGFEHSYTPSFGAWYTYGAGSTVGGWQVDFGNIDVQQNGNLDETFGVDGEQHIDLNGSVPGQISQEITGLTPGRSYTVRFNYAPHHLASLAEATIQIADLNQTWQATNSFNAPWLTATYNFTASSTSHTLRFTGGGPMAYAGMSIDAVALIEHPAAETESGPVQQNLALNQPAIQSSQQIGSPAIAVDGNNSGDAQLGEVTQTNYEEHPWWQVDLGENQSFEQVVLWNQTDCCGERLHDFYIFASDSNLSGRSLMDILDDPAVDRVYSAGVYSTTAPISITKEIRSNSRYVRIQAATSETLGLAEVQVLAPLLPPSSAPTQIAPSGLQSAIPTVFEWNDIGDATAYEIYIWDTIAEVAAHSQIYDAAANCDGTTCSVSSTGISLNTDVPYLWWVRGVNAAGNGPWSSYSE